MGIVQDDEFPEMPSPELLRTIEAASVDDMTVGKLRDVEEATGETGFTRRLLERFVEDARLRLLRLRESKDAGDMQTLQRVAHSMKGSAGTVGAVLIQEVCARMEQDAKQATIDNFDHQMEVIEGEVDRLATKLDRHTSM
jgi:HPt (histidine-containing phosphotransfer) domain-containing protein